jgi:sugar lactone lactonase YvrE
MIVQALNACLDRFLGRGDASVTVPPMDGALKPNNLLDEAQSVAMLTEPDNLLFHDGALVCSSGAELLRIDPATGRTEVLQRFDGPVTAMATDGAEHLAVATASGEIRFFGGAVGRVLGKAGEQPLTSVTTLAFLDPSTLLVCIGSAENPIAAWQRDLLTGGRSGSLWRFDLATGQAKKIAGNLAYPNGIFIESGARHVVISESWGKRLLRIDIANGRSEVVLDDLPGYPSRICPSSRGGAWLTVFAPRSQLIEFVLRERKYRNAMMAEVPSELWIAPALRSGISFQEPMQGGALKQMGILKPWAPTRSYGLVVELDRQFEALRSLHSRAAGRRHGITSAVEMGGALWLSSKGGDEVLKCGVATVQP